jgi:hypothetical protein
LKLITAGEDIRGIGMLKRTSFREYPSSFLESG